MATQAGIFFIKYQSGNVDGIIKGHSGGAQKSKIFSGDRGAANGLPVHCARGGDDKEKCCLESRSWLNLGHPDAAYTFSTILLFLLSALPRVRNHREEGTAAAFSLLS